MVLCSVGHSSSGGVGVGVGAKARVLTFRAWAVHCHVAGGRILLRVRTCAAAIHPVGGAVILPLHQLLGCRRMGFLCPPFLFDSIFRRFLVFSF